MSDKAWKDALLASGQPLEHAAADILSKFELTPAREYSYIRNNESGLPTEFSIDLHASQIGLLNQRKHWVDYLIECKYRRDGTNWIFTSEQHESTSGPRLKDAVVALDLLSDDVRFSREYIEKFSGDYRFCTRGCEVIEKEKNTTSIERAISQLRYAVPNLIADGLEHQIDRLLGDESPVFITVPILLTTANLWALRKGVTIENIRQAEKLEEVADNMDILVLFLPPDNLLQGYTKHTLDLKLSGSQREAIEKKMRGNHSLGRYDLYRDSLARDYPSYFVVVHLRRFEECIRRLTSFFNHPSTFTAKK